MELNIRADVVATPAPFPISLKTLQSLSAQIDFRSHVIMIPSQGNIICEHSPSGHLLLPGEAESMSNHTRAIFAGASESLDVDGPNRSEVNIRDSDYNLNVDLGAVQLQKLHRQMGHCSKASLLKLLQAPKRKFSQSHLDQVYAKCKCQHTVGRITPPLVSSVLARRAGKLSR